MQYSDALLKLLHLADSALPIGSTAHSYGLETLVFDGEVTVAQLDEYFHSYLQETGFMEAVFVRCAYSLGCRSATDSAVDEWRALNHELAARKVARESRAASATLGRRLLRLALSLEDDARLNPFLAPGHDAYLHHATVFGLIGGVWVLGEDATALAYLQQSLTGLVSACQRLMPLGQQRAQSIIWSLQPTVADVAQRAATVAEPAAAPAFTPLLELASIRHPELPVRLFIS